MGEIKCNKAQSCGGEGVGKGPREADEARRGAGKGRPTPAAGESGLRSRANFAERAGVGGRARPGPRESGWNRRGSGTRRERRGCPRAGEGRPHSPRVELVDDALKADDGEEARAEAG